MSRFDGLNLRWEAGVSTVTPLQGRAHPLPHCIKPCEQ